MVMKLLRVWIGGVQLPYECHIWRDLSGGVGLVRPAVVLLNVSSVELVLLTTDCVKDRHRLLCGKRLYSPTFFLISIHRKGLAMQEHRSSLP